jgi:hypothetical protein
MREPLVTAAKEWKPRNQLGKLMLYQLSYVRVAIRIAQQGR